MAPATRGAASGTTADTGRGARAFTGYPAVVSTDERQQTEEPTDRADPQAEPGREADNPVEIPARGWWQVTRRALKETSADHVPMLAGGVAFFAFLAIFPAIIAAITLYGLVADPATVAAQAQSFTAALPQSAQPLVAGQIAQVTRGSGNALTVGLVISLLAALWSASSGVSNLMQAVNIAYDEDESRGFVKLRATALLLTLGAIVFVLLTLLLVAVVPAVLAAFPLGPVGTVLAQVVRWVLLVLVVTVALAVVYRLAPDRDAPRFRWVSVGAVVATVLWIIGSVLFSLYVNNFGRYGNTYGALAGVVVLLLWLYLTSFVVLLGAEINAESERQTARDSTKGEPLPRGERGAVAADEVVGEADPVRGR
jgi:membrane protein